MAALATVMLQRQRGHQSCTVAAVAAIGLRKGYGGCCGNYIYRARAKLRVVALSPVVLPWLLWQLQSYGGCCGNRSATVAACCGSYGATLIVVATSTIELQWRRYHL